MLPKEIAQLAVQKLNKKLSNEIFLIIQNDRELMQAYLKAVEANGVESVNKQIGKEIKAAYQLVNINQREDDPSCTLIKSHQMFE
ncbi:hypothetical protein [Shewanella halifaxensis]|uniref:hypothetical protein n=1 Tax=Shewanella halifaxensis TaxID=271098 RepID=UPI000D592797|nr:hypothetical protein [Shewanella halifaxensis]